MVDKTVNKTIHIQAPVSKVWEALTDPGIMKQWMSEPEMRMEIITDWKIGNAITIRGDLHGIPYNNRGTILRFEPGNLLAYSYWSSLSLHEEVPENHSVIEITLSSPGNQTILSMTQNGFVAEETFKHFEFYWNIAFELLKRLMEKSGTSL